MARCEYLTNDGKRCKNKSVGTVRVGNNVKNACHVHLMNFKKLHMLKPDKTKRFGG